MGEVTTCPDGIAGTGGSDLAGADRSGVAVGTTTGAELARLIRMDSSPSRISISPRPDSSSISISFLTLRMSMTTILFCEMRQRRLQRKLVAMCSETADNADGNVGEVRMTPEGLTRKDVRQMYLDKRDAGSGQRVAQGHTGMRESGRIENNEADLFVHGRLHPVYQLVLGVALEKRNCVAGRGGALFEALVDFIQANVPVDLRFTRAKEVQVGSIDYQELSHADIPRRCLLPPAISGDFWSIQVSMMAQRHFAPPLSDCLVSCKLAELARYIKGDRCKYRLEAIRATARYYLRWRLNSGIAGDCGCA